MKESSLLTLARTQRWELDQLRREAGELHRLRNELLQRDADLVASLEREGQISSGVDGGAGFGLYLHQVSLQRETIGQSLGELDSKLDEMQDRIAAVFQEAKRYEVMAERMQERRRQVERRREQAELDEIGLNNHRLIEAEKVA
jgi:flagellar FliJ protein